MRRIFILLLMFYFVNNIFSIPENIVDLENIYNEIVSHKHLWENLLNRHNIVINYEDILKMERKETFLLFTLYSYYAYQNIYFEQSTGNENEYWFHTSRHGGFTVFIVFLDYIDGKFLYREHSLRSLN